MKKVSNIINGIMVNIGQDDFNHLVLGYNDIDYIRNVENQVMFNETFLKLFKIFCSNFFIDFEPYLKDRKAAESVIKSSFTNQAQAFAVYNYGKIDILVRTNIFIYSLFVYCDNELNPYDELVKILTEDTITAKKTVKSVLKYMTGKSKTKEELNINSFKLFTLSILSGNKISIVSEQIIEEYNKLKEIEENE